MSQEFLNDFWDRGANGPDGGPSASDGNNANDGQSDNDPTGGDDGPDAGPAD